MAREVIVSEAAGSEALGILQRHGESAAGYLKSLRDHYTAAPARLLDAIDYSLLAGGKRLRPVLVLECFEGCSAGKPAAVRLKASAIAAAGAIELIHTFSLVHDDLPAMDNDDLRRGRPTNHKVFGDAMAILAGDAMVTMAFELVARDADPRLVGPLVRELASASGPDGMIGGQVLDMDGENKPLSMEELKRVHRLKTGALLTASCRLGAIAAGADEAVLLAITRFGQHLGLAFQIVDDILDVTSTPQQLGKATRKDASKGKNTYPGLLGLEASHAEAVHQLDTAISALAPLGAGAQGLRALARFVADRTN